MEQHDTKTAFITGAATRVGRAMALALGEMGYNIALHFATSEAEAQHTAALLRDSGRKAALVQGKLEDMNAAQWLADAQQQLHAPIGLLINNAGLLEREELPEFTAERFERQMHIHLKAPLLLSQAFTAQLPENAHGHIINITDSCEGMSLSANFLSYTLAKKGLNEATRLLAISLAPRIRVNAIAPGLTLPRNEAEQAMFMRLQQRIPLKRTSSPDEVVNALRFLLTTPSITGQVIALNGGLG